MPKGEMLKIVTCVVPTVVWRGNDKCFLADILLQCDCFFTSAI